MGPRFKALGDLAVAATQAAGNDDLVAEAEARAAEIVAAAKVEAEQRIDGWRAKWQAARAAGWSAADLQSEKINQSPPPAPPKARKARTSNQQVKAPPGAGSEPTARPETGLAGTTPEGDQPRSSAAA